MVLGVLIAVAPKVATAVRLRYFGWQAVHATCCVYREGNGDGVLMRWVDESGRRWDIRLGRCLRAWTGNSVRFFARRKEKRECA
jgi:hypothetical protein